MKRDKRTLELDLPEPTGNGMPSVEHSVDYSSMAIGQSAGLRKVVEECPICHKPCITKHNDRNLVFVHHEVLKLDARNNARRNATRVCRKPRFEDD